MSAWKLVPVVPPPAMVKAGELHTIGTPHTVWKHMLSASPDPTTDEALVKRVCDTIVDNEHLPLREFAIILIRAMGEKPSP